MSATPLAYPQRSRDNALDNRELVRLLQCEVCHRILQQPLTLPCGQTLCRSCLPCTHKRRNISYPNEPRRLQGFACPFEQHEGQEHAIADCDTDIILASVLAICDDVLSSGPPESPRDLINLNFAQAEFDSTISSPRLVGPSSALALAYRLAQQGLLPFHQEVPSDITFRPHPADAFDKQLLTAIRTRVRSEFDCHICYCLYYQPVTTSCGHTFCKSCLERVRDHSNVCPLCRRSLSPYRTAITQGGNKRLKSLLIALYPSAVAAREIQAAEPPSDSEHIIPIFACSMAFPQLPMFLHIFEPRYRLMLRRAINDGTLCFGMVSNQQRPRASVDGDFEAPFTRYGTMLCVTNIQSLLDGRSIIETIGTYRFRILSYVWQDGYPLAKIERLEDIPFSEEETIEAAERENNISTDGLPPDLAALSTQELHQRCIDFVKSIQNDSAEWFTHRLLRNYGPPPEDPALLPFWMAALLPLNEREKYLVLVSTSVRERLKLIVMWTRAIEPGSWGTRKFLHYFLNRTSPIVLVPVAIYISLVHGQRNEEPPINSSQPWLHLVSAITAVMVVVAILFIARYGRYQP